MSAERPAILLSGSSRLTAIVCDLIPSDIHVISLPELRISESGFRNLGELNRFGVVLFCDGNYGELHETLACLKAKRIPYMIGLETCPENEFTYRIRSQNHFLLSQPVSEIRQSIGDFVDELKTPDRRGVPTLKYRGKEYIWVRAAQRDVRITLDEVLYLTSDKDYIIFKLNDNSIVVRDSLKAIYSRLFFHGFERIHKSCIVQLGSISEIRTLARNQHEVQLINGTRLPIGRTYWPTMRRWLHAQQMERSQHNQDGPPRARPRRAK